MNTINSHDEKELIAKCLTGDKASYDALVRKYTKFVYNSIYRTLELKGYKIDADLVFDLHQDIIYSLIKDEFKKLRQFEGWSEKRNTTCSFATWLGVVTRNYVLNFIRSDSKQRSLTKSLDEQTDENKDGSLLDTIEDTRPSIKETLDNEAMINILNKHYAKLDVTERTILDMFYVQNIPLEEIARVLGKSEDAVFMQKKRIIEELQKKIKKDVGF